MRKTCQEQEFDQWFDLNTSALKLEYILLDLSRIPLRIIAFAEDTF